MEMFRKYMGLAFLCILGSIAFWLTIHILFGNFGAPIIEARFVAPERIPMLSLSINIPAVELLITAIVSVIVPGIIMWPSSTAADDTSGADA